MIVDENICYYYSWIGAQLDFIHSWVMYASLYDKKKASDLYNKKKHLNKDMIKTYKEELSVILSFWGISIFILAIFAWDYKVAYDKESILYSGIVLPKKSSNKGFSFVEYFRNNKTKISEIWKAGQTGSYVLFANGTLSNNVVIEQNVGDAVYYYCKGGVHMNKKVQVKSPLPDYEFSLLKSDIQPDVIESEGVAVVVGYTVLSEDGYVFKSTSNLNSISDKLEQNDNIKITNKDIDEGKKIIGYDNLGVPVILTFRAYKEGEMLENTTWAIGGLQQRNHALTGGYHGVELAFTTYAIKYAVKLGMLKDLGMYLLHRFGDVFAHFNMKNDVKEVDERNITPVSLNEYPNCLKSFFDSNLVVNVPRNESKQISLKEDGVYFINGKFYSTYDRIKTEKIIVESILTANSQIKRYTPISDDDLDKLVKKYEDNLDWIEIGLDFDGIVGYKYKIYRIKQSFRKIVTHSELHEFFLKLLENSKCKVIYNNNVMYGDQVTCKSNYTSGHSSDDTKPDDIIRRDKLFMRYVRCVSELYPMLSSSAKIVDGRDPVEVIRRVVDWGVEAAKVDENMLSAKLDGIFNFLIELEKGSGENSFSFSIPIKSLPEEIDTGLAWLMYSKVADKMHFFEWEFSKSANKQAKILRDYLDEMYKMYNITTQQFKKGIKVDVTSK